VRVRFVASGRIGWEGPRSVILGLVFTSIAIPAQSTRGSSRVWVARELGCAELEVKSTLLSLPVPRCHTASC